MKDIREDALLVVDFRENYATIATTKSKIRKAYINKQGYIKKGRQGFTLPAFYYV